MQFKRTSVVNFSSLLLEYAYKLNLTPIESYIILLIDHLKNENIEVITDEILAERTNCTKNEINGILVNLYKKKFIDYVLTGSSVGLSIEPTEKMLYKELEKSVFSEDDLSKNALEIEQKTKIYSALEDLFQRSLTNAETARVDDWLENTDDISIILNSIKDAKAKHLISIYAIDKIIIRKLREMDSLGNEITRA